MTNPPFNLPLAHRWFAVELNNLSWQLVETDHLSPPDIERMIHSAHAACFHWFHAGNLLNHLRAQCLLATAYTKANLPESALRHAQRCLQLSTEAGPQQTPFDRASVHGCASLAYKLSGRPQDAAREYEKAKATATAFDDPADVTLFDKLYPAP